MVVLAIKVLFAPFFILLTHLIQKKFGARSGGIFMAIPFIVIPILIVLYIQEGAEFFHEALIGTYVGQVSTLFYILVFANLATRHSWLTCLIWSTSAYIGSVLILSNIISTIFIGVIIWTMLWITMLKTFPKYNRAELIPSSTKWDLPLRIASALFLIFTITAFAENLGAQLSGALAMYPVMTSIMSTFNHYRFGSNSSIALLHGLTQYLFVIAFIIFPLMAIIL